MCKQTREYSKAEAETKCTGEGAALLGGGGRGGGTIISNQTLKNK